ncbi:hypothetical protein NGK36_21800, partial [Hafnia alvei]|nr:hypothetical protein [Hafnia alvei]
MTHVINEAAIFSTDKNGRALVADLQYFETYTSTALNRKLKGIVNAGVYRGFKPLIGDGLSIIISSTDAEERIGVASVDVGESQITIQQILDVNVHVPAGKTTIIALEANYEFGKLTDQVDSSSTLKATQIITVDVATGLAGNQIELCRVIVPEDATAITEAMVDISHRISQAIGIQLSADLESDAENIGANSKAINDLRKKLLGEESQEGLDTISALAKALGGDPDFVENLSQALKEKQPLNESLSSLSGLQSSANKLPYFNGKDTMSLSDLSQTGRDLISKDSIDKIFEYLRLGEAA